MDLPLLPLFIGLVVVALVVLVMSRGSSQRAAPTSYPYERRQALVTPAERSFLGVLEQVVPKSYRVYAKVNLTDVLKVRSGLSRSEQQRVRNGISQKHLDFVLCRADDLGLVAGLELDDRSHQRTERQRRDAFLESACAAAGLPLLRVPARQVYSLGEVRALLAPVLGEVPAPEKAAEARVEAPSCPAFGATPASAPGSWASPCAARTPGRSR